MVNAVIEYDKHEDQLVPSNSESGVIGVLARAELDGALVMARQYPRPDLDVIRKKITKLATSDEETAEDSVYALPRGGKPIKGPSIRFAEIVQTQYGNNGVASRVLAIDRINKVVIAEGVFHDYETNIRTRREIHRRISDKNGRLYNDDMIIMTGNAGAAIAQRNAILAGVPHTYWNAAYRACEQVIAGDIATLPERKTKALKAFAAFGIKPEQIAGALNLKTFEDIGVEHMATLVAMHSALKNGEETVETMFDPRRGAGRAFDVVANPLKDDAEHQHQQHLATELEDIDPKLLKGAFERGREEHRQGVPFKKPPDKLSELERASWQDGWNAEDAETRDK